MTSDEQDGSHIGYISSWLARQDLSSRFELGHDTNEAARCAPALSPQTEISPGPYP